MFIVSNKNTKPTSVSIGNQRKYPLVTTGESITRADISDGVFATITDG